MVLQLSLFVEAPYEHSLSDRPGYGLTPEAFARVVASLERECTAVKEIALFGLRSVTLGLLSTEMPIRYSGVHHFLLLRMTAEEAAAIYIGIDWLKRGLSTAASMQAGWNGVETPERISALVHHGFRSAPDLLQRIKAASEPCGYDTGKNGLLNRMEGALSICPEADKRFRETVRSTIRRNQEAVRNVHGMDIYALANYVAGLFACKYEKEMNELGLASKVA